MLTEAKVRKAQHSAYRLRRLIESIDDPFTTECYQRLMAERYAEARRRYQVWVTGR